MHESATESVVLLLHRSPSTHEPFTVCLTRSSVMSAAPRNSDHGVRQVRAGADGVEANGCLGLVGDQDPLHLLIVPVA
jgi:hypothetical protein